MAKLAFTKLGLKINDEVKTIEFNEQTIEVKQYLPINEKLEVITEVLNNSVDDNNFANPVKVDVYTAIAVLEAYTNISFTEKQKENVTKLYDTVVSTGFYNKIIEAIPYDEINSLIVAISDTIDAFYSHQNSILGILEAVTNDYSNLNLNAADIQQKLADPENMALLRDILTKLG